jgi:predicted AAA+ superfamily ATPase
MKKRPSWEARVEDGWRRRSIVWLTGVRRVGKTTLCRSLPDTEYFDCELPSVRRELEDVEGFLRARERGRIVLDEVHRLADPATFLKIAADHFPRIRIVATGSSTLGVSARFRDTLAGRKEEVWLTPMTNEDLQAFGDPRLPHRLLHGGLPPFFLADAPPDRDFQEWLDAFWAKDVQELFRLERRHAFQRLFELMLASSGGIFEATRFARACEVSRQTVQNYLAVLEATFVAHVVRPFTTHKPAEIVAAPKVYGFDTGFVAYHRGWTSLRPEDLGALWEHFVLNELHAANVPPSDIRYWRDKQGHEIDFVLAGRLREPIAVECKWNAASFTPNALTAFRQRYSPGRNYVVSSDTRRPFDRTYGALSVHFVGIDHVAAMAKAPRPRVRAARKRKRASG